MVGHCIQPRTCAPTVSVRGRNELWPFPSKTRVPLWSNLALRPFRKDEVHDSQASIPSEESNAVNEIDNERHRWTRLKILRASISADGRDGGMGGEEEEL